MDLLSEAHSLSTPAINDAITIVEYDPNAHFDQWEAFVKRSMNGTVFHFQQFLRYHPADRFAFKHLMFFAGQHLVAVLPGGQSRDGMNYESPLGASYGSFVVEDISADTALGIVEAFKRYLVENGFRRAFLTSAPVIYQPILTQNLEFALLYKGFYYQRHYISHVISLDGEQAPFTRFQSTARKHVRRIARDHPQITVREVRKESMVEGLQAFYPILLANKAKYDAKPTHTLKELLRLNELLPGLMKLFLVYHEETPIAGSLLFLANQRVAIIFYHMLYYEYKHYRPIYLLMQHVTDWAKRNGFSFIDIGVSQDTSDDNPMTPALSLIRFKEKFDSRGVLRSTLAFEL